MSIVADRSPPHDITAERAVLGGILLRPEALADVGGWLLPAHFYHPGHRLIYETMQALAARGQPIDAVTLGSAIQAQDKLPQAGGAHYLGTLTDNVATVANIDHYARIVQGHSCVRAMMTAASYIYHEGLAGVGDVQQWLIAMQAQIAEAAEGLLSGAGPRPIDDDLLAAFRTLERGGVPEGLVKTGLGPVDDCTGGLWPGQVTVLGARPSMGKSLVAQNVALNAAWSGRRVLAFSLEDIREFFAMRALARVGSMDLMDLTLRRVRPDQFSRLMTGANRLTKLPLWVDDSPGLTSQQIHQIAAAHKARHGLDLVVIDHLAEMTDQGDNDTASVSNAARGVRNMAKVLHVPVLLCHQLNRGVEGRADKRPTLGDLRQSGTIEAVARGVWFLYRPAYYSKDASEEHELQLIVAKMNHGKTGTLRLWVDMPTMYVRGWEEADGSGTAAGAGDARAPRETEDERRARLFGSRRYGSKEDY